MSDTSLLYTPAAAGAVSGLKLKAVHNDYPLILDKVMGLAKA
jgi:hypothetical protein